MDPMMQGQMPPGAMPGMPGTGAMPGMGGMPGAMGPPIGMDGMMPCPCCGQLMSSPNTMGGAPNVPMPPGIMGGRDQDGDMGALLQALMGAGGSQ